MDPKFEPKAEIDFRDLLRRPRKLFGYSYFYFLILLAGLGFSYVGNLTVIGKNSVPAAAVKDSSAFVQDIPFQSPALLPPVDVMKVSQSTPELVQKGKDLFRANCASCHGETGQGDGPAGAALNPKPRNFTSLVGWTNGPRISQMYKTLQEGIVKNGMASYSYLPPVDRFALIHYVRTLASGYPDDTREDLQALETTYQLSKGVNTPGQIPVKKATEYVLKENQAAVRMISALVEDEGAALLERVVLNKRRVLTALVYDRPLAGDLDQFVKLVSSDPVQLGFRANVVQLSNSEWLKLYEHIRAFRGRGGAS